MPKGAEAGSMLRDTGSRCPSVMEGKTGEDWGRPAV
jgi:hypothetical protein